MQDTSYCRLTKSVASWQVSGGAGLPHLPCNSIASVLIADADLTAAITLQARFSSLQSIFRIGLMNFLRSREIKTNSCNETIRSAIVEFVDLSSLLSVSSTDLLFAGSMA
jgi:hypothetical protein